MCQTTVERLFDRVWPGYIRKVASLFAQALSRSSVEQIDIRWYWPLLLPLLIHPYPAPGLDQRRLHRRVGVRQAQMQVRMRRIGEPVAGVGLQGAQLPRHPGKVAVYVPRYVLRVLWPHSSTSRTTYATTNPALFRCPDP